MRYDLNIMKEERKREQQSLSPSSKNTAISFTGGKDCNLALLHAWRDERFNVKSLIVFRPEEAEFKAHPLRLMEEQAECLGLPLHHVIIKRECTSYKDEYINGMKKLKEDHGIEVIVTGDMDLVGTMARNWIEECGEVAGIETFLPLWKADREDLLRTLVKEDFEIIFSCVKSPWFDASWIGRQIDDECIDEMKAIVESSEKAAANDKDLLWKPLDLGGERGEYHTMCIFSPLYNKKVQRNVYSELELTEQNGQKNNQRWWVIKVD